MTPHEEAVCIREFLDAMTAAQDCFRRWAIAADKFTASVDTLPKGQDAGERLGPKDEHAVDSEAGETPK